MPRAKVKPKSQLAPRRTSKVLVASPYSGFDQVERILDVASLMYRHRQISSDEYAAAERLAQAFETGAGSIPCVLGQASTPRTPPGPREPPDHQLRAARLLDEARSLLGELDFHIVSLVCRDGMSVHAISRRIFVRGPSARDSEHIGRRFRLALAQLSVMWFGSTRSRIRSFHPEDATPTMGEAGEIPAEAIGSVQASARGVRCSPGSR